MFSPVYHNRGNEITRSNGMTERDFRGASTPLSWFTFSFLLFCCFFPFDFISASRAKTKLANIRPSVDTISTEEKAFIQKFSSC